MPPISVRRFEKTELREGGIIIDEFEQRLADVLSDEEIAAMRAQLEKHKAKYVNFLMGQALKVDRKLNPKQARAIISRKLDE